MLGTKIYSRKFLISSNPSLHLRVKHNLLVDRFNIYFQAKIYMKISANNVSNKNSNIFYAQERVNNTWVYANFFKHITYC